MKPQAHEAGRRARADDRSAYPAEKARQGTIILRHWWSRAIFIAGLAAGAIFAIVWSVAY